MAEVLAGLRAKALFGLYWTGGLHLLGQLVTWPSARGDRLLAPADYGLLAMATVFVGLLWLMAEAGLNAALMAPEGKLRAAFAAVILVDGALFLVQLAAAPAIASSIRPTDWRRFPSWRR